nr:hypothetical protein [Kribbella solani]
MPRTLADLVAQHLVASGRFLDDDPELAYQHARTARRLAARLGGVREAVAITAYLAEHYDEALTEFRAVRRMTGNHEVLAMMADCERALGRPDKALALIKDKHARDLSEPTQIELLIVAAGARRDLGQTAAAIQMLEVPELTKRTRAEWLPRLRYAYADALAEAGRTDDALIWFHRAAGVDGDGVTGAAERAAELEGLEFTDLDEESDGDEYVEDEYTDEEPNDADEDDADEDDADEEPGDADEHDADEQDALDDADDAESDGGESDRAADLKGGQGGNAESAAGGADDDEADGAAEDGTGGTGGTGSTGSTGSTSGAGGAGGAVKDGVVDGAGGGESAGGDVEGRGE